MTLMALPGIPLVQPGDDLAQFILESVERAGMRLQTGDALAVTSKPCGEVSGLTKMRVGAWIAGSAV